MNRDRSPMLPEAILLLGPTGSGKTPLGELIEREGLGGHKCVHFDFGSQLRRYAAAPTGLLSTTELEVVKDSLRAGTLLADDQFLIAEKLLRSFIKENNIEKGNLIILNGLPRHAGQAAALETLICIVAVAVLDCDAPIVLERIRTDAGGDRGGRIDDMIGDVTRKLAIFEEKTSPLVRYYETRCVPIIRIGIGVCSSAEDNRLLLADRLDQLRR